MLSDTLNTNEIKDSTDAEVEFSRLSISDRATEFAKISETPSRPHRLNIKHVELGTGVGKRRRSVVRFDLTVAGQVDTSQNAVISFYVVGDIPIGNMTSLSNAYDCLANLISFTANDGSTGSMMLDGQGNGADVLLNGSL